MRGRGTKLEAHRSETSSERISSTANRTSTVGQGSFGLVLQGAASTHDAQNAQRPRLHKTLSLLQAPGFSSISIRPNVDKWLWDKHQKVSARHVRNDADAAGEGVNYLPAGMPTFTTCISVADPSKCAASVMSWPINAFPAERPARSQLQKNSLCTPLRSQEARVHEGYEGQVQEEDQALGRSTEAALWHLCHNSKLTLQRLVANKAR